MHTASRSSSSGPLRSARQAPPKLHLSQQARASSPISGGRAVAASPRSSTERGTMGSPRGANAATTTRGKAPPPRLAPAPLSGRGVPSPRNSSVGSPRGATTRGKAPPPALGSRSSPLTPQSPAFSTGEGDVAGLAGSIALSHQQNESLREELRLLHDALLDRSRQQQLQAPPSPSSPLPQPPPAGQQSARLLRKRHARWCDAAQPSPTAGAPSGESPICCIAPADTTVWCAHEDGRISIHEKDGMKFGIVTLDHVASAAGAGVPALPRVTAMAFVPQSYPPCMAVLYSSGCADSLDAGTGARLATTRSLHRGSILSACTHRFWRQHGEGAVLCQGVLTCSESGTLAHSEVPSLEPAGEVPYEAPTCEALTCIVSQGGDGFESNGDTFFTGGRDGGVAKWQSASPSPARTAKLDGHIADLALLRNGRELWVALSGVPQRGLLVLSALTLDVLAVVDETLDCIRLLPTRSGVWVVGNVTAVGAAAAAAALPPGTSEVSIAGRLVAYCPTTREATSTLDHPDPLQCTALVSMVHDDHELWSAAAVSSKPCRQRDTSAIAPAWCAVALKALEASAAQKEEEFAGVARQLRGMEADVTSLGAKQGALQGEAMQQARVAEAAEGRAAEAKKRCALVEARYGDLRGALVALANERAGERRATYSDTDLVRVMRRGSLLTSSGGLTPSPSRRAASGLLQSPRSPKTPMGFDHPFTRVDSQGGDSHCQDTGSAVSHAEEQVADLQTRNDQLLAEVGRLKLELCEEGDRLALGAARVKALEGEASHARAERDQARADAALWEVDVHRMENELSRAQSASRLLEAKSRQHRESVEALSSARARLGVVEAERDELALRVATHGPSQRGGRGLQPCNALTFLARGVARHRLCTGFHAWRAYATRRRQRVRHACLAEKGVQRALRARYLQRLSLFVAVRRAGREVAAVQRDTGCVSAELEAARGRLRETQGGREVEVRQVQESNERLSAHIKELQSKRETVYTRCEELHDELTAEKTEGRLLASRNQCLEAEKRKLTALVARLQQAQTRSNEQLKAAVEEITTLKERHY